MFLKDETITFGGDEVVLREDISWARVCGLVCREIVIKEFMGGKLTGLDLTPLKTACPDQCEPSIIDTSRAFAARLTSSVKCVHCLWNAQIRLSKENL